MDLTYSPEELAFQHEVRAWLKANVPKRERADNVAEGAADPERIKRAKVWQRKVHEAGYLAMGWPQEFGGRGADVMRQTIFNEELVRARAPQFIGAMGIQMVGPTLISHGTDDQKRAYLPKILSAEEIWCQGYS
jgi:alkylation response protein AidB-like acyl-CoA dehydrogenase